MSSSRYVITGAARRGGAAIARCLHQQGHRVTLHCRPASLPEAQHLCTTLNSLRPQSAETWVADLHENFPCPDFAQDIHGVVCNASEFSPSSLEQFDQTLERDLATHLTGHLRLIRYCLGSLRQHQGAIVAIGDIHLHRPNPGYLTYHIAKNALVGAMQALAVELAPLVRVNTVMPGPFDWPLNPFRFDERTKAQTVAAIPLERTGRFDELAQAVKFLLCDATYTTGVLLPVDGGLSLQMEGNLKS